MVSSEAMDDLRRYARVPLTVDVQFSKKGSTDLLPGKSRDLSLGGMFIETYAPLAFKSELVVHVHLPGEKGPFTLPAVVRWTSAEGMGVQFGNLGARETYAITQAAKQQ
jgi:type IV pilus assembly protein PilZ